MIPCEKCLLIPICRHKIYGKLIDDCEKLWQFMYVGDLRKNSEVQDLHMLLVSKRRDKTDQSLKNLEKVLKPSRWFTEPRRSQERLKITNNC